jgi:hypothetical protein
LSDRTPSRVPFESMAGGRQPAAPRHRPVAKGAATRLGPEHDGATEHGEVQTRVGGVFAVVVILV